MQKRKDSISNINRGMNKLIFNTLVKIEQSKIMKSIPDKLFISLLYFFRMHRPMKWKNPQTYNEKLNWMKLYDRHPEYVSLVDKYEVKQFVKEKLGIEYSFPTLGIWESFDQIDFNTLPNEFVLKCTHDSGGIKIIKDKNSINKKELRDFFKIRLNRNYYYNGREWYYKNIKPRIIAEPLMKDESNVELKDYKIFCFDGEPKIIEVDFDRYTHHHRNLYSLEWELINAEIRYPSLPCKVIEKPIVLNEMIRISRLLSSGMKHVRVDLYVIEKNIYVGEMTFFHENGCGKFRPKEYGLVMGSYINLNNIEK